MCHDNEFSSQLRSHEIEENLLVLYFGIIYPHTNSAYLKCAYVKLCCAATEKRSSLLSNLTSFSRHRLAFLLLSEAPEPSVACQGPSGRLACCFSGEKDSCAVVGRQSANML